MLKQIATILLLLVFTMQVFNRAVIVLGYYSNTTAFAQNCVNKAKPTLQCKGQCQMLKKLKEEEKKENHGSDQRWSSQNEVMSSRSFFTSLTVILIEVKSTYNSSYTYSFRGGIKPDIFHPPGLV